jgi:hypothetical protein
VVQSLPVLPDGQRQWQVRQAPGGAPAGMEYSPPATSVGPHCCSMYEAAGWGRSATRLPHSVKLHGPAGRPLTKVPSKWYLCWS